MKWNKIDESEDTKNIPDANDITSGKRLYIVDYGIRGKRGTSYRNKLVDTDDIEKYINDSFAIGYSWKPKEKTFNSAIEVVKTGLKYIVPLNADYWYTSPITFNEYELKHTSLKNGSPRWYDYSLKEQL